MATGNEPSSSTAIDGELLEKAMRELNENPDTREQAISDLRNAITSLENDQQYQGVVFERRDSPFLLRFLRARKFDQERALSLYAHYYSNKRDYPEIFKDLNVRNVADVLSSGAVCSLDSRMNDGSNVICIRPARWDMDRYQPGYVLRTVILIMEKLLENEETQIHGVSIFHYMQDLEFTTLWRFSQSEVVQKGTFFSILQVNELNIFSNAIENTLLTWQCYKENWRNTTFIP
jgi:retinaldehyde-binding protein 1